MIDYSIIQNSIDFYTKIDYKRIESPWTVTKAVSDITKPKECSDFEILNKNKVLVASGEQSFLYLYLKGFLPKGKFQTVTPCFRDEVFDVYHSKYFIKNELIITDEVSEKSLSEIIEQSRKFFLKYLPDIDIKKTEIGYDLEFDGHELGSYGIRSCPYLTWVYGTGVAEPRLSTILNEYGLSHKRN